MQSTAIHDRRPRSETVSIPDDLTSPRSKLVYLYLAWTEGGTVDDLSAALREKQLELYPVLDSLVARDHVERDGEAFQPVPT